MRPVVWLAAALAGAGATGGATPPALDWPALAERIVAQLQLEPGERVALIAQPGTFDALLPPLRYALARAGAAELTLATLPASWPAGWDPALLRSGQERSRAALRPLLRQVDAAVMLPGAGPTHAEYAAMSAELAEGRRAVHFHWHGGGAPSAISIGDQPLPPQAAIDALYQRAVLEADCAAIGRQQRSFEAALRSGEVRVTTPAGSDLRFRIGERPVNRQDGDASRARALQARIPIDRDVELPCGVVRVAPLEESVEGVIAFPPGLWAGARVEGLAMRFRAGRLVWLDATAGLAAVEAELQAGGDAARAFREFGLGFNPLLAVPREAPWIPYYGYGAGVVRLSLGDNSELGGEVRGGYVRWNFFADATLQVAGTTWVRDGALLTH